MNKDKKIDLVYLWVDGNDKAWQKERTTWANKLGLSDEINLNKCRYIDNQELKYSLRSAQMFAPWINKIFIITNGQIPKWLNANHPKIKIIKHSDIMPQNCLPTFNSEAIETCIANIPELSEHFLCANDDKFFASFVTPSDFFDINGNPIVKMRKQNWQEDEIKKSLYKQSYKYTAKIFSNKISTKINYSNYEPIHCIEAYRKSYFLECKELFINEFTSTMQKKFRAPFSIQHPIVDMFMAECKNCLLEESSPISQQDFDEKSDNLYITLGNKDVMEKTILAKTPKLLCINDGEMVQDKYRKTLKELLEKLFPIKQAWEIDVIEETQTENETEHFVFAFDSTFLELYFNTLKKIFPKYNKAKLYQITILHTNISEAQKLLLINSFPKNYLFTFIEIEKINNQSPYMEELNLTNLLATTKPNEKIVFWGASIFLENIIKKYELKKENILGIIDINPYKKGEFIEKYQIYSPEELSTLKPDKIIISIINATNSRLQEIKEYLNKNHLGEIKIERI